MEKFYKCTQDLQGCDFAVGRICTVESWRENAIIGTLGVVRSVDDTGISAKYIQDGFTKRGIKPIVGLF